MLDFTNLNGGSLVVEASAPPPGHCLWGHPDHIPNDLSELAQELERLQRDASASGPAKDVT